MQTLAYGLVALVALTTLAALAPSAAAAPIDQTVCTPDPSPQHPLPQRCVDVYSDPLGHCVLRFWIPGEGGGQLLCFT